MTTRTSLRSLGWALSLPFDDERARRAARQVLDAPNPSRLFGILYPIVLGQKGLQAALAHLERAGADLRALSVPTAVVRTTFPLNRKPLWPIPDTPQWRLADLADVLSEHRRLLWEANVQLARRLGPNEFVLLSGLAVEALYPTYRQRMSFDSDLWMRDVATAVSALEVLIRDLGYEFRFARVKDVQSRPHMGAAVVRSINGFQVKVGIRSGSASAATELSGRRHFYLECLDQRSTEVKWGHVSLQTPSPEDMLVMVALRVQRRRTLQMVNLGDVAVLLGGNRPLDLARVKHLSRMYRVEAPLSRLLAQVEVLWPGIVPSELKELAEGISRFELALMRRALGVAEDDWMRLWLELAMEVAVVGQSSPAALGRIGSALYRRVRKRVRQRIGITPIPTRHPMGLPLCGIANLALTQSVPECEGRLPGMRWDAAPSELRDAADRLLALMPPENHRCRGALWKR
jgi:hypothetical protein